MPPLSHRGRSSTEVSDTIRDNDYTKPHGTRDLLFAVFLVALHFSTCKFAVHYRDHWIPSVLILTPAFHTALLQLRFNLSHQIASISHYPLCLAWAFLHGATYSMFWNRVSHGFFERHSVGLDSPLRYGVFCMEVWAIIGVASTAIYYFVGCLIKRLALSRTHRLSRSDPGDEPCG